MHFSRKRLSPLSKVRSESDIDAAAGFAIKDGAGLDGFTEHFFKAQGLRAELDRIAVVRLTLTPLVFHGKGCWPEFDDIRSPGKPQASAQQG